MRNLHRLSILGVLILSLAVSDDEARSQAGGGLAVEHCPETSPPTDFSGQALDLLTELKDGVVFDSSGSVGLLRLKKEGGTFKSTPLGLSDTTVYAAVADFDKDGWDDFVGAGEASQFVRVYRNFSFQNLPVDWNDPNAILQPKFTNVRELHPNNSGSRLHPLAAGDFNGDGWADVFWASGYFPGRPFTAYVWLNRASNDGSGNPRFFSAYDAMASGTQEEDIGQQEWSGTSVAVVDYNGDRKLDLLIGSAETDGGSIRIFLNNCTLQNPLPNPLPPAGQPLPCSSSPRFSYAGYLIRDMGLGGNGAGELPVFAFRDFDGDGLEDLVAGSPKCCSSNRLRVYKGLPGGGIEQSYSQSINWVGGATAVLAADFSLDGKLDLLVGADNWNYGSNLGGTSYYYKNDGDDAPFSAGKTQTLTTYNNPTYDFDVGFVFNYDNDPDNTPDVMIADGNHTASFYVFANRTVQQYVQCGDVNSGVLDLGALSDVEMVVTAARLSPTYSLNGGSINFFMSNEEPANWQPAVDCGDGSGDLCTTFSKPVGREVRWKATMCSNSYKTQTPQLIDLDMTFDYAKATEHYRAGVVVNDGVAYVGAFRQPGDRGHFYALNAGLTKTYWDAADKLDAMSDTERKIYTATDTGSPARLDFESFNASDTNLQTLMQTSDPTQTAAVIDWARSGRFGIGNQGIALSRLGSVETSTPAIIPPPGLPLWYAYASATEKTKVDTFIANNATRPTFAMFGSKDGMVHAVRNNPTNITDPENGKEAWAFVPPKVASTLLADYSNSLGTSNKATNYPDGSPTAVDVKLGDGEYHTVAIVGGGNGNKSFVGLEIGDSIATGGTVNGPTPLWSKTPGGNNAGQAFSKSAVARVKIGGQDYFQAIFGTGIAFDDLTAPYAKGKVIQAFDIATGQLMWRFRTKCPLTSDIVAVETDDDNEPGNPELDGYIDRVIFSDSCGYVYKVDPAKNDGAWNDNNTLGTIPTEVAGGVQMYALFSTTNTIGALGHEAPIAGTIAARPDASTRLVLFFGTGGVESYDPAQPNHFYAVYADNGSIRSKFIGPCTAAGCSKFYGGAVVTTEQVIFTSTIDPKVGTGTCDPGSSTVHGFRLNADAVGDFETDFSTDMNSAVMSSLYGDAGAIYFATLGGEVVRIGTPRSPEAGGDTATGSGGGMSGSGGNVLVADAMTIMGWRQVF